MGYPDSPGYQNTDTSERAAEEIGSFAKTVRASVLNHFNTHDNLTADEVAQLLDLSVLTVRPRVTELKKQNLIFDTGMRRRNTSGKLACALKVTIEGKDACEARKL